MGYLAPVDIDNVADVLECEERYADGQQDDGSIEAVGVEHRIAPACQMVHHVDVGAEGGVINVGEEVGILEIAQHEQVDGDTDGHLQFSAWSRIFLREFRRSSVHPV